MMSATHIVLNLYEEHLPLYKSRNKFLKKSPLILYSMLENRVLDFKEAEQCNKKHKSILSGIEE